MKTVMVLTICIVIIAFVVGYQVAREKYERKGKWYTAELENPMHYEEGKEYVYGIRWNADYNGEIVSVKAFIYDKSPLAEAWARIGDSPTIDGVEFWSKKGDGTGGVPQALLFRLKISPKPGPKPQTGIWRLN